MIDSGLLMVNRVVTLMRGDMVNMRTIGNHHMAEGLLMTG